MTRRTDLMAAMAVERLNRSIGQRARRAREAIGRQAASDRAAVDRLCPAPRIAQLAAIDWQFIRLGSIGSNGAAVIALGGSGL